MYNMYNITKIHKKYVNSWLILTCCKNAHILHHREIETRGKCTGNMVNVCHIRRRD